MLKTLLKSNVLSVMIIASDQSQCTPSRDSRSNDSIISYDTTLVTQMYNELNWASMFKTFLAMTLYTYFCIIDRMTASYKCILMLFILVIQLLEILQYFAHEWVCSRLICCHKLQRTFLPFYNLPTIRLSFQLFSSHCNCAVS